MINRIKEARLLFLKKGIMKREVLRSEIALSWARSQVYSVDPETPIFKKNNNAKKLVISKKLLNKYEMIDAIFVSDTNGNIIGIHQSSEDGLYKEINFSETSLGTNGIALAISSQKKSYVSSYEHYHQLFFEKITYGIPFESSESSKILGIILNDTTENFREIQKDLNLLAEEIIQNFKLLDKEILESDNIKIDELFPGKSEMIKTFIEAIQGLKNVNKNVFLVGKNGSGKEMLARYIHQESQRHHQKFYSIYCDKLPTTIMINQIFEEINRSINQTDSDRVGTIYIESFELLSYKSQELLMRLLESKLVNSKAFKTSDTNDLSFIFSSTKTLKEIRDTDELNEKLLNRINVFTLEIPALQDIKEDLPLLVSKKIEKYSKQYYLDDIQFAEALINALINYNWPGNYRELDKVIEQIVYKGRSENVIDLSYLPTKLSRKSNEKISIQTLEKTEQMEIIKALDIMNHNIASTAKILGIGRSTLYRKLDKYNIEY